MISVEIDTREVDVRIKGIGTALQNLQPVFDDFRKIFTEFEKTIFRTEGAYGNEGNKWVPLNPQYAAWKRNKYGDRGILQKDYDLRRSLTDTTSADMVYETGPAWMEIGTSILYARTHQYGDDRRNIPARPPLPKFTRAEAQMFIDALMSHVLRAMRGVKRSRLEKK